MAAVLSGIAVSSACAAETIVIGRSLVFSGPLKPYGEAKHDGGDAYNSTPNNEFLFPVRVSYAKEEHKIGRHVKTINRSHRRDRRFSALKPQPEDGRVAVGLLFDPVPTHQACVSRCLKM